MKTYNFDISLQDHYLLTQSDMFYDMANSAMKKAYQFAVIGENEISNDIFLHCHRVYGG